MYRIIACDLDETLLNSDHQVSDRDIETIARLGQMGVKFVLATGRGYNTTFELQKKLGLYDKEGEYTISFNGGFVTENRGNRALYKRGISFETASALYREAVRRNQTVHVYTEDTVYIYNYIYAERKYVEGRMPIKEIFSDNIDFLKDEPIIKALYMDVDIAKLQKIAGEISDLTEGLAVSYSSNRYLEFNNPEADKGIGLKKLAGILNVPLQETIAVGDHVNDLRMLRAAGLAVGVHNANSEILGELDILLDASNNHDPITEIYERFYK